MDGKNFSDLFAKVRANRPLVHHITNYVTVNDCANITLCIGAAPVMAHAREEVSEMVSIAGALVLNIGTLDPEQIDSMLIAGRKANDLGIPIILDPVGAGATRLRTDSARRLLHELEISVVKGNAGEIGVLAGAEGKVRGVDSDGLKGNPLDIARDLANRLGITVIMSGPTDIITDGSRALLVDNGHEMMGRLSGTGCMASSIAGSFAAVSEDHVVSSAAALASFGLAGERAAARSNGPFSFKMMLFDELYRMAPEDLEKGAKVRVC